MRRLICAVLSLAGIVALAGCRTTTHVTEVPRVDLNLEHGNRGYFVGTPPPPGVQRTTRQLVETSIELPGIFAAKRIGAPSSLDQIGAPPGADFAIEEGSISVTPTHYDVHTVQKGETLWSIAAHPQVYGKATRWRQIFDANRDLLSSPDAVTAGMALKIPRGGDDSSTSYGDEGITVRK